jgi:hypothetical protein
MVVKNIQFFHHDILYYYVKDRMIITHDYVIWGHFKEFSKIEHIG